MHTFRIIVSLAAVADCFSQRMLDSSNFRDVSANLKSLDTLRGIGHKLSYVHSSTKSICHWSQVTGKCFPRLHCSTPAQTNSLLLSLPLFKLDSISVSRAILQIRNGWDRLDSNEEASLELKQLYCIFKVQIELRVSSLLAVCPLVL